MMMAVNFVLLCPARLGSAQLDLLTDQASLSLDLFALPGAYHGAAIPPSSSSSSRSAALSRRVSSALEQRFWRFFSLSLEISSLAGSCLS